MKYTPNSKAAALVAQLHEARENISAIGELRFELFSNSIPALPANEKIHRWLIMYGFDTVVESVKDLGAWQGKHQQKLEIIEAERPATEEELKEHSKTLLDLIRYASGIMRNKKNGTDKPCQTA